MGFQTCTGMWVWVGWVRYGLSNDVPAWNLVHITDNPWVTSCWPVPTPTWNPYLHLWVWVHTSVGMGTCVLMHTMPQRQNQTVWFVSRNLQTKTPNLVSISVQTEFGLVWNQTSPALLCCLLWVLSVAPPHVVLQHVAAHHTTAVWWCWHATCIQRLFSNEQSTVTYLVTEPMLKRKLKWQRVATWKKSNVIM